MWSRDGCQNWELWHSASRRAHNTVLNRNQHNFWVMKDKTVYTKDKTTILLVKTHKDSFRYGVRAIPGDIPVTFGAMPARGARDVSSIWFQLNATDYHHLRGSNDSFKQPPWKSQCLMGVLRSIALRKKKRQMFATVINLYCQTHWPVVSMLRKANYGTPQTPCKC